MPATGLLFAKCVELLRAYEARAERERLAAAGAATSELASVHRFLAIEYEADADELSRQLAAKA